MASNNFIKFGYETMQVDIDDRGNGSRKTPFGSVSGKRQYMSLNNAYSRFVRAYVNVYVHTYACTYVHTYIHAYIHTYKQSST